MRATLLLNPDSGDCEPDGGQIPKIRAGLGGMGDTLKVVQITPESSVAGLAREALAEGAEAVIVGGGDGTVSVVARELVGKNATLGILPIGTFNNIARSIGVLGDLQGACEVIAKGVTRQIDIGMMNGSHAFFEAAGAGLDATLFPLGEEIKSGRWSRIFSALRLTFGYRAQPVTITLDRPIREALPPGSRQRISRRQLESRTIRRKALLVVAANGPYYGGGFTVAPDARLQDGLLTLSIYTRFSKLELARHFWSISHGHYRYSPKIETYNAAKIVLESPAALPVHVDGQPFERLPVTLTVAPHALRVFAPERPQARPDTDPPVALPALEDDFKTKENSNGARRSSH